MDSFNESITRKIEFSWVSFHLSVMTQEKFSSFLNYIKTFYVTILGIVFVVQKYADMLIHTDFYFEDIKPDLSYSYMDCIKKLADCFCDRPDARPRSSL